MWLLTQGIGSEAATLGTNNPFHAPNRVLIGHEVVEFILSHRAERLPRRLPRDAHCRRVLAAQLEIELARLHRCWGEIRDTCHACAQYEYSAVQCRPTYNTSGPVDLCTNHTGQSHCIVNKSNYRYISTYFRCYNVCCSSTHLHPW